MLSVSVVIPTRNERDNIANLLSQVLPYGYEVVVVDDSDDDTAEIASSMGARVIRGQRKGLAQAVLDGIDQTNTDAFIVMDADLQHPPSLIPSVVDELRWHDLVVVSKHCKSAKADLSWWRKIQSNLGVWATKVLIPVPVSDPMTGFFAIRRKCLDGIPRGEYIKLDEGKIKHDANELRDKVPDDWERMTKNEKWGWYASHHYGEKLRGLEGIGFKIGLELFAKAKWVSHAEIPMSFGHRQAGKSKGTMQSLQKHIWHLLLNSFNYKVELPKGSEEYYYFYEGNGWHRKWKQDIAMKLREISYELKPNMVVDIGCGSSPNINYLHGKCVGVDVNERAINFMRGGYSNAEFKVGDVRAIPMPTASCDMVVCIEVLEHLTLSDVQLAISEIVRVLRNGGHAILATPNYGSVLWNIIETAQRIIQPKHWTSDHQTKFNHYRLSAVCKEFGLTEIRCDMVQYGMDMLITYAKKPRG